MESQNDLGVVIFLIFRHDILSLILIFIILSGFWYFLLILIPMEYHYAPFDVHRYHKHRAWSVCIGINVLYAVCIKFSYILY